MLRLRDQNVKKADVSEGKTNEARKKELSLS